MPIVTSPDNIPAPAGPEGVGSQIFQDMVSAVQAAITSVRNRANNGVTNAANAQTTADLAYRGYVARHRQTSPLALQSGNDWKGVSIAERQYGWPLSQGSGQPTRIYIRRTGLYLIGGELGFLPPAASAAVAGIREAALGINGNPYGTPSPGVARADRSVYARLSADLVYLNNGDWIELLGRHGQGAALEYTAHLWSTYVGVLPS